MQIVAGPSGLPLSAHTELSVSLSESHTVGGPGDMLVGKCLNLLYGSNYE